MSCNKFSDLFCLIGYGTTLFFLPKYRNILFAFIFVLKGEVLVILEDYSNIIHLIIDWYI